MIDKNIVRYLQFRDTVLDTDPLEVKYGIALPPIYRSFISVFKPYFAHLKIKKDNNGYRSFVVPLYSSLKLEEYTIDNDELSFDSFMELEKVLKLHSRNPRFLEEYLFIAEQGYSDGLMLGIGQENQDKIYHNNDTESPEFFANNIFEFLSDMKLVHYDFDEAPVDTSKLYKNWGEDFWRKRKEDDSK